MQNPNNWNIHNKNSYIYHSPDLINRDPNYSPNNIHQCTTNIPPPLPSIYGYNYYHPCIYSYNSGSFNPQHSEWSLIETTIRFPPTVTAEVFDKSQTNCDQISISRSQLKIDKYLNEDLVNSSQLTNETGKRLNPNVETLNVFPNIHLKNLFDSQKTSRAIKLSPVCSKVYTGIESDAERLHTAFEGIGCDSKTVYTILACRSCVQRNGIANSYARIYNESLIDRIIGETFEPLRRLMVSLLYSGPFLDAFLLTKAKNPYDVIKEDFNYILATRSFSQISEIKSSYQSLYGEPLELYLNKNTSGNHNKIIKTLINVSRDTLLKVDDIAAEKDCQFLIHNTNSIISVSPNLIDIFSTRNYLQLKFTFEKYRELKKVSIYNYLKRFRKDDYAKTLRCIYNYSCNPIHFHAKYLKEGFNNNDIYHIIKVISTRNEVDLHTVVREFETCYNTKIKDEIHRCFKFKYCDAVEAVCLLLGI